jgi:hypothetical protein
MSRISRFQGGQFQPKRLRDSVLFETRRVQHPDDAIVKIAVQILSEAISVFTEDKVLSPKCMFKPGQEGWTCTDDDDAV